MGLGEGRSEGPSVHSIATVGQVNSLLLLEGRNREGINVKDNSVSGRTTNLNYGT